ncbi:hypothetical protein V494_04325 [Pseudogymnoascus sp. VKM F-4513 (FW-928)]|nr:hypothetical protein V494_04325 [Pseudogymnoascus sp. VKM F-4513 (FW-928)]
MNNDLKLPDQSDLLSADANGVGGATVKNGNTAIDDQPFSIFTEFEKRFYAWCASVAAFAAPVSSTIYYPALNLLAEDLHTTPTRINLTITTYLIFQGIAPTIVGGISDKYGRRPALLACFVVYIAANTGLALQHSFAALLVLRCVQSSGCSGTISISNGVVSDVATRAERGSYVSLAAMGQSLGPALGPIIGGLLTHFLGWRSIFWFLDIYAGVMLVCILLFMPETCRNIVGNGSVPSQKWNVSLMTYLNQRKLRKNNIPVARDTIQNKKRPSLLASLSILVEKEASLLMIFCAIYFAGFSMITASLPSQLSSTYNFNSIQVGLCYIPIGAAAISAKTVVGRLIDWNFRRHCKIQGLEIIKSRQQEIDDFPAERARLEVSVPLIIIACVGVVPYGWVMGLEHPPLGAVIVLLFLIAFSASGLMQTITVLLIDCHPNSPAAVSAANNVLRCLLAAGAVAIAVPLFDKIGRGLTGTLLALVYLVSCLLLWAVVVKGPGWRKERQLKREAIEAKREEEEGRRGI